MECLSKDKIELTIMEFRAEEQYNQKSSEFSHIFDLALEDYAKGNFTTCASLLIKCSRMAEGELRKEDYKVWSPLDAVQVHLGGGSVWHHSKSEYYLKVIIDTLHDASIVMLLADDHYTPGQDVIAIDHALKTTAVYSLNKTELKANKPVSDLLPLKDPLGEALEAADTTRKAAFIMAQICLRKILLSFSRDENQAIANKIAGIICVITLTNDDQAWKSEYGLSSLQSAMNARYCPMWIKDCADAFRPQCFL